MVVEICFLGACTYVYCTYGCIMLYYACFIQSCSLFEDEISRMNPQAIVPPQPLQPPPTVGECLPIVCMIFFLFVSLHLTVFHTEGGVPWDFPSLNSDFPPSSFTDSTVYFVLLPLPVVSGTLSICLRNNKSA